MVSWKEAAEINELVVREALVIPSRTLSNVAGSFLAATVFAFSSIVFLSFSLIERL